MKVKETAKSKKQFNRLIAKIAQQEIEALRDFYSAYGKMIYSFAYPIVKSACLADEVVDEVLVKIWQVTQDLLPIDKPIGWLYTVTVNCAKDKRKKEKLTYEIYDIPQDDKNIEELFEKDAFLTMISCLDEEEQQIMILHFIQDIPFKSIAKEIQKPLSTVSSVYYRALDKIRKFIK